MCTLLPLVVDVVPKANSGCIGGVHGNYKYEGKCWVASDCNNMVATFPRNAVNLAHWLYLQIPYLVQHKKIGKALTKTNVCTYVCMYVWLMLTRIKTLHMYSYSVEMPYAYAILCSCNHILPITLGAKIIKCSEKGPYRFKCSLLRQCGLRHVFTNWPALHPDFDYVNKLEKKKK